MQVVQIAKMGAYSGTIKRKSRDTLFSAPAGGISRHSGTKRNGSLRPCVEHEYRRQTMRSILLWAIGIPIPIIIILWLIMGHA